LAVAQAAVRAQDGDQERTVEGVWRVTIVPRFCATGDPIPGAAAESLWTFHKDRTMDVWAQNNVITTTRSPSQGLWRLDHGWSDYSFGFVHLRYDPATGAFIGRQEAKGTLVLGESGDDFSTDSSTKLFDVNGNLEFTGCAKSVGTRFKLEP
jgi:hypothetical protein